MLAYTVADELIILESNSKSEDRDDNLDNTLAFNTRDSEQLSHDALEIINTNQNWEVNKIIGKKYVNGVLHYLVKWCPTLEPVHLLEHAKELVDEFEARRLVERKDKKGHMRSGIKRGNQAVIEADVSGS